MAIYRVREGRHYGPGKVYGPGSLVGMEPHEAAPFLDLLEIVGNDECATLIVGDDGVAAEGIMEDAPVSRKRRS